MREQLNITDFRGREVGFLNVSIVKLILFLDPTFKFFQFVLTCAYPNPLGLVYIIKAVIKIISY